MADQGVRYVVTLQDMNVTSGLKNMESSAMRTEASISSLNSTLGSLAGAFGVGLGLHQIVNFGKDAVQGAADYETAVKRIKFASDNLIEGEKNIAFIRSEVDKFKIPLQQTTDAYGKFLAMVTGSGMAGDQVRKLHDELLLIGKVKGLGDGQLDAAVMNLGKMLESGSLDARHFRPLEQQLSGIGAFVAKELGITVHQLAVLRNQGKMTTIDPRVLLTAIEKQAASLEHFLPESTNTIQSGINEVNTAWLEFKNNLVFDNRAELIELFDTLKDGVAYLREHKDEIISLGHFVMNAAKVWLVYKGAMVLVNTALGAYRGFMVGYLGQEAAMTAATTRQTAAFGAQTVAVNALVASIERLNFVQNAQNGAFITNAAGVTAANTVGNRYLLSAGAAAAGTSGAAVAGAETAGLAGMSIVGGALLVTLSAVSIVALAHLLTPKHGNSGNLMHGGGMYDSEFENQLKGGFVNDTTGYTLTRKFKDLKDTVGAADTLFNITKRFVSDTIDYSAGGRMSKESLDMLMANAKDGDKKKDKTKPTTKILPPKDHVTGQRVITYNIRINEVNGQKIATQSVQGTKADTQSVAASMRDIITSILNDSQIRAAG